MTRNHISLASLLLFTYSALAQTPPSATATTFYPAKPLPGVVPPMQMMAMPLIGPLFIQTDRISSSLMMVNNAATSTGATITLRTLTGQLIVQKHIKLDGSSQHEVALTDLLFSGAQYAELGSVSVLQDEGTQGVAVNAQLLIVDQSHSTPVYIDEELAMPSMEGSSVLRGVTDASEGSPLLAISNLADKAQIATVKCLVGKHAAITTRIALTARATSLTAGCSSDPLASVASYVQGVTRTGQTAVQGMEIVGDSGPGTLAAFAFAPHVKGEQVILSGIPFTDPQTQKSSTIVYAGVPVGLQAVVSDGTYVPHIALTNFSAKQATVVVTLTNSNERSPRDGVLATDFLPPPHPQTVTLKPGESTDFLLDTASNEGGLTHSLTIQSDQPAGMVQSKVVSRGNGELYQVELLGKDIKDQENAGGHPWTTQGDHESHLLLFNSSSIATTYVVHIAAGQSTWEKKYVLAANETRQISINRLIREAVKDDTGRVLDATETAGVAYWSTIDPGHGTGRLLVSSRSAGSARNFSCGYTIVICGAGLSINNNGFIPIFGFTDYASVYPQFCLAWGPGACSNLTQTGGSGGASYYWGLGNTNIVNFNTAGDQYSGFPNLTGVSSGSTYAYFQATENGCSASGSGNPAPVVQSCPTTVTLKSSIARSLPSATHPGSLTGIGILTQMLVSPLVTDYTGVSISEVVTPTTNTCPSNIAQYTALPSQYSLFTVGANAAWEGLPFPSTANVFYDQHVIYSNYDVLGFTSGNTCSAAATQVYSCNGVAIGKFLITNTYTHGSLSGTAVTNITTIKK